MCTDKEHGGKRCQNDISSSRRQRRKASHVRENFAERSPISTGHTFTSLHVTDSPFKEQVEEVKTLINSTPPEGSTQSDHDMRVEQKITELGMSLGQEAEKRAGFNAEQLKQDIADLRNLYIPFRAKKKANEDAMTAIEDKMYDYTQKKGLEPVNHVKEAPSRADDFSDEEGRKLFVEAQEIAAEFDAVGKLQNETDKLYNSERSRIRNEVNDRLISSYQSLIAEIRPVGGNAVFSDNSDSDALALMEKTVNKHYPTEWLQHHNSSSVVTVKKVAGTASYNPEVFSDSEDDGIFKAKPYEFSYMMDVHDKESQAVLSTLKETFPDVKTTVYSVSNAYGQEVYFKTHKDELYDEKVHGVMNEAELVEAGWEHRPSIISLFSLGDDSSKTLDENLAGLKASRWVRQETTTREAQKILTVNMADTVEDLVEEKANPTVGDRSKGVAYHEFGHRMEDVMPGDKLTRYEKAFLKRRAGKTDENFHEQMIVSRVGQELYHEGGFVTKYTGRSYANSKYCEVFTTGIQALYSGDIGGLVGNSNLYSATDLDHRGFVLGALATL